MATISKPVSSRSAAEALCSRLAARGLKGEVVVDRGDYFVVASGDTLAITEVLAQN